MSLDLSPATRDALDLSTCDRERIHEISMVQAYGAVVVFSFPELKIRNLSENLPQVLGLTGEAGEFLGTPLGSVFESGLVEEVLRRVKGVPRGSLRQSFEAATGARPLDLFLYPIGHDLIAVEVCPHLEPPRRVDPAWFDEFVKGAKNCHSVEELCQRACETVRRITGLDRVMAYRFFPPSWYGEVVAEDRVAEAHSFREHRFPASDIPRPARELYLRNQVRLIYDAAGEDAPLLPAPGNSGAKPLDLSDSRLRSVSRVHLAYLRNMGVRCSFSVSITVNGELWGLIACHGRRPTYVSHACRSVCENVAHTVALFAPVMEANLEQRGEIDFFRRFQKLFEHLRAATDPREELLRAAPSVMELFDARGLALVEGKRIDFTGQTPMRAEITELAQSLRARMEKDGREVLALDSLAELDSRWEALREQASGVLAVRAPALDLLFLLFRPELLQTVKWGGDPRKAVESRNYQGPLNPRESFATYTETIRNTSAPWRPHEVEGANFFRSMVFESLIRRERLLQELGAGRAGAKPS